ncbi:MAG: hypothetical protein JWQ18_1836 [Conexibacter sp.]|nr:hypothetical protein [Conexibacter sp.]
MFLPPLLSDRPPALRVVLTYVSPVIGGFLTGMTLGLGIAAWVIANVIATLAGFGAGFDHDTGADAARRGATGGALFGLSLVLADALVVDDRVAKIADPAVLQALVTTIAGTLLALAGTWLRSRIVRRRTALASS